MKTEIYCKSCYLVQEYDLMNNKPENCKQCNTRFSAWHIDTQLRAKGLLHDFSVKREDK